MQNLLVAKSLLINLIIFAEQRGISHSTVATYLGTDHYSPGDNSPDQMVPLKHLALLYEYLEIKLGDKDIGLHVGELYNVAAMGLVGQLIQNSRTVEEALQNGCDFFNLVSNGFEMRITKEEDHFKLQIILNSTLQIQHPIGSRHIINATMAYAVKEIYYLIGKQFNPTKATVAFDITTSSEHLRILGITPKKSKAENYLCFESSILDKPLVYSDYQLLLTLESVACERIKQLPHVRTDFSQKVSSLIYSLIDPSFPTIEQVANNLHMTPRTVQRKLKQESTTFASISENIKKDLAVAYLQKDLTIKEVSYLMGYTESSSFVTAFKKWFGKTPVNFRSFL